jgi:hypothetical protein
MIGQRKQHSVVAKQVKKNIEQANDGQKTSLCDKRMHIKTIHNDKK